MRDLMFRVSGFLASVGMLLIGLVRPGFAQWKAPYLTLHMGTTAHSILNKGMSGRRDNGKKQELSSFSYPQGRNLKVYSGGADRSGWNNKVHSAGEGIWVMSRTDGQVKVAYAGTDIEPPDIVGLPHDPATYPEACLGASHHPEWALSVRNADGVRQEWTDNIDLRNVVTNYWPSRGPVNARSVPDGQPAVVWNYHFNAYKDGRPFSERIAAGVFGPLALPVWAEKLSEDDFPDVIGITKAMSKTQGLQWTRRWFLFGHADYDDVVLNETVVENTGTRIADDVYLVVKNRLISGAAYAWCQGSNPNHSLAGERLAADDYIRSTLAPNYLEGGAPLGKQKPAGSPLGRQMAEAGHAMLYLHDGEQVKPAFAHGDWGDPFIHSLARTAFWNQNWVEEGYYRGILECCGRA